ncbi:MAG: DUF642 domain-containing protein, partial [Bacteroidia bacterium]|nr:DUF642 domain-containing protein [Bacteroidia bacterium]
VGSYFVSSDGKQSLDLHGTPGFGGVRQTLKTIPSQEYTVEFKMSGNPAGTPVVKVMQLIAAGQSKIFEFDCTGKTEQEMGWQTKKWSFVADSHLTTLAFVTMSKTGVANYGPVIDDVRVYPSSGSLTSNQDLVKNIAPHAQLAVTTVSGGSFTAPVQVQFNPQGSYDPDGQIVLFELDKDGDGYFEVSEKGLHGASMEFTEPGTYTAMLRVTDDKGETKVASHTFQILSGNIIVDDSEWYRINNWKPRKNGDGRYFTPDQDLCIESMVPGGVWFSTNRPYSIDHDYIVEFEVKMNETDNHFVFLYSDGFVGIDIDWGIDLGHTQPGASYNLRNGLGNLTLGAWHKIRVEAHPADKTFDLYLNDNKVSTATGILSNQEYHTNTTNSFFDGNHDVVFIGDVDKAEFRGGNYNRGSTCWRNFRVFTSHFTGNKSQVNDEFDEIGYDIKLELDKTSFTPGEKIKVYFDRGDIGDNTAWLGIVPSGIAHDSEDENERFANQKKRVRQKDGNMIFFAPDEVGLYDIRFHDMDNEGREIASASFMVLEEGKVVDDVQVKEIHVDVSEQDYGPIIFKFSPLRVFEGLAHIGLEYELMKYFSVEADIGYYFNVPPMLYHEPLIPMKEIFDQSDEPWSDLWDLAESYTYWPLSDFWQNNGSGINLTGAFKYYFDGHLKGGYISGEYRYKKSSWSSNDEFDEAIEFDVTANAFNIVLGKQRQINNSMWTDVFIGWGIRDVKLETNFGGDPYEEKFYYNIVLGWKLGLRF